MDLKRTEEGDPCRDPDCDGTYEYNPVEGCTCHISPPCHACIENPLICDSCGDEPNDKRS